MNFRATNTIIAASLTLSLAGLATPSFAQNQRTTGNPSYRLAQAAGPSETKENDAQTEDREVSQKIDKARSAGKDVTTAEKHQKLGEAAMSSGHNKTALQHFEQAEAALGENEQNEEHEEHGGESHEGGTY